MYTLNPTTGSRRSVRRASRLRRGLLAAVALGTALPATVAISAMTPPSAEAATTPVAYPAISFGTFYNTPTTMPATNGDLIRYQPVSSNADEDIYKIMYRSTQTQTVYVNDAPVTTVLPVFATAEVSMPKVVVPTGGFPTVAFTHGIAGVNRACAPSNQIETWRKFTYDKNRTAKAVAPDYIGLGVDNPNLRSPDKNVISPLLMRPFDDTSHPVGSLQGEGRATIDSVRAANQFERVLRGGSNVTAGQNKQFIVVGGSQGGHGALATGEVHGQGYAPDLDLKAVVAGTPAGELQDVSDPPPNAGAVDTVIANLFSLVLVGQSLEFRDIHPSRYITGAGQDAYEAAGEHSCVVGVDFYLAPLLVSKPFVAKPSVIAATPEVKRALVANSPGHLPIKAPVFVGKVENDKLIPMATTDAIVAHLREQGDNVLYCKYAGGTDGLANHGRALDQMWGDATARCTTAAGQTEPTTPTAAPKMYDWLATKQAAYIVPFVAA